MKITRAFLLGTTEVTQAHWKQIMGNNPSIDRGDDLPVHGVSWNDAAEFCRKLSQKDGRKYRLPTEAEWEYACRAGTTTAYSTGPKLQPSQANYDQGKVTRGGTYKPNAWGLYDMHGNLFEWCADWYGEYATDEAADPVGPAEGEERILRGGSFGVDWHCFRSAFRLAMPPGKAAANFGFRVAVDVQ